jgi:hypothetical protein
VDVLHKQLRNVLPATDWIAIEAGGKPEDILAEAVRHLQMDGAP